MAANTLNKLVGVPRFFPAALEALQLRGGTTHRLQELSDADWHDLLAFCDLAHLTLPLVRNCQGAAPGWVQSQANANLADNRIRISKIQSAYKEIAQAFEVAGIQHLVIKGFAQYPAFVESLEYRMQSDIDLYCPEQSIPAALATLTGLGYTGDRTLDKYPADHMPEMTRRLGWRWRGNEYDPEMPPSVDLHFCFWNSTTTRLAIDGVRAFWGRRMEQQGSGFAFPTLCLIDNLAFSALHVLRDLQRGDWVIHHVYELAWFLHTHTGDEALWRSWRRHHDDSLRSLQLISFWLARDWFNCRWAPAIDLEMITMPRPVQEWLERFSKSPLTAMFHPNKHGVWLHLALLESRWDKLRILSTTLIPFRLPAVGAPGQDATKARRIRSWWPSQRYAKYVLHVTFRIAFHLQTLPGTLWLGLCWWLGQRRLSKSF